MPVQHARPRQPHKGRFRTGFEASTSCDFTKKKTEMCIVFWVCACAFHKHTGLDTSTRETSERMEVDKNWAACV
jgi:hypothetical protein